VVKDDILNTSVIIDVTTEGVGEAVVVTVSVTIDVTTDGVAGAVGVTVTVIRQIVVMVIVAKIVGAMMIRADGFKTPKY
jgi:hypothetical protein